LPDIFLPRKRNRIALPPGFETSGYAARRATNPACPIFYFKVS